jgi:succinoglycan biosynthesis transport protein ExoP
MARVVELSIFLQTHANIMNKHTAVAHTLFEHSSSRHAFAAPYLGDVDPNREQTRRSAAMRRRLRVFSLTLVLCLLVFLSYSFLRDPIYMASARVQITPAGRMVAALDPSAAQERKLDFLIAAQKLNSRPLLGRVVPRLQAQGYLKGHEGDPVARLQAMLTVTPLDDTQIVRLQTQSGQQALVAPLINTVIDAYRDEQLESGDAALHTQLVETRDELAVIERKVATKKKTLDAFKARANIVSGERDENQTLSRLKGIGDSLSLATDREAIAAGRIQAIEQAIAEHRRTPQAKDNPTVANIEQRLSQQREDWRALERQFTPQYLELDANARGLKLRIANLEQQLETERVKSQQLALADAREELSSARGTTARLQQQLAEDKQGVQLFSRQMGDYQSMQEELTGLESMRMAASEKLLAMESSARARRPRIEVVEAAAVPDAPWRPLYWRDAGISVAAAIALAFLAVWFVEFFNRAEATPAGPTKVILTPSWPSRPEPIMPQVGGMPPPGVPIGHWPTALVGNAVPRELRADEAERLLKAAATEHRAILACLLCGLSTDELAQLRLRHVDPATGALKVPGESSRILPAPAPVLTMAAQRASDDPEVALFINAQGRALEPDEMNAVLTSSAYDARLEQPESVTVATMRYTYLAFLVRQGVRFSELGQLAGRLNTDTFHLLAPLAPDGQPIPIEQVERLLPAVRAC